MSGNGAAFTVTVVEADMLPPAPVHVSVYVVVPVAEGVSAVEPLIAWLPDHAPDAVHEVAFVELHVSVVVAPSVMVEGVAAMVTVGCGTDAGLTVTVAIPVILVYPGIVDAAVIVAVVTAAIVAEEVNTPPVVIVPALVGLTDQVTAWLGLFCPTTVAENDWLPPAVTVAVDGLTVTEVTVVVVPPPVLPAELPPQPTRVTMVATMPRQNSLDA
jgi:hypothetical protein